MRRGLAGTAVAFLLLFGAQAGPAGAAKPASKAKPGKIPASVLHAITSAEGTAPGTGALTPAAPRTDGGGRIQLDFHAARPTGGAQEADLRGFGATGIHSLALSPDLKITRGVVEAWVPKANVVAAAALPWVTSVTVPSYSHADAVTSAGVALHKADLLQQKGITGAGVKVGVVSDGVQNLAAAQATGDLGPVNVVEQATYGVGTGDEGTAMLEIVHDMAPGAALLFHAAGTPTDNTEIAFVHALDALRAAGANVIVHDIGFIGEPVFQAGLVTQVTEAIAATGVSVHTAAGNLGDTHAPRVKAVGTGQGPEGRAGPFTGCSYDPANTVAIGPGGRTSFEVQLIPNVETVFSLQWSEPRSIFPTPGLGGFTDLDLFLMSDDLTTCLAVSDAGQGNGAGDPFEAISGSLSAPAPVNARLVVNVFTEDPAFPLPPTLPTLDLRWVGGAAAVDPPSRAGSMDAVNNFTSGIPGAAAAFNAATGNVEAFSSGGPVDLFTTAGCPAGTNKSEDQECPVSAGSSFGSFTGPAWTAADRVAVSGAGSFPTTFAGTSAAAPHAAGCDALVRQAIGNPAASSKAIHDRLAASAFDYAPTGTDTTSGAGILDCKAAAAIANVALTNAVSSARAAPGGSVTYSLGVTGTGPDPGTKVTVVDVLPAGERFQSSTGGCTAAGQTVSCPLGAVGPGESRTFTITAAIARTVASGTTLEAAATLSAPFDNSPNDNAANAALVVGGNLPATGSTGIPTLPAGLALLVAAGAAMVAVRRARA